MSKIDWMFLAVMIACVLAIYASSLSKRMDRMLAHYRDFGQPENRPDHLLSNSQLDALNMLLDSGGNDGAGGIHKRISEIREVTNAIAPHARELDPALISWLSANDQFLCNLRDNLRPEGVDKRWDQMRELFRTNGERLPEPIAAHRARLIQRYANLYPTARR